MLADQIRPTTLSAAIVFRVHPFLAKKAPGAPVFGHCPLINHTHTHTHTKGNRVRATGKSERGRGRDSSRGRKRRRRSKRNRKLIVDAKWETGETWVERGKIM